MKDYAYNIRKIFILFILSSTVLFVIFLISISYFFQSLSDEIMDTWYQGETISIQSGNIINAVTKLERKSKSSVVEKTIYLYETKTNLMLYSNANSASSFAGQNYTIKNELLQKKTIGLFEVEYRIKINNYTLIVFLKSVFLKNFMFGVFFALLLAYLICIGIIARFSKYREEVKSFKEISGLKSKLDLNLKISELAQQVAHDIRSPLSSLNMISSSFNSLPEEQKNILIQSINRINSIANDLLEKGTSNFESPLAVQNLAVAQQDQLYVAPTLKNIISEKRAQYKNKPDIFIIFDNNDNIDESTNFPKSELERILSNMINNATESLVDDKGEIIISLNKTNDFVQVTIKDNGKGIPKDILNKIGQKGFSYGKEHLDQSGSGLGLYHAKKTMHEFCGELLIESELGVGTTVTLKIPLVDQQ